MRPDYNSSLLAALVCAASGAAAVLLLQYVSRHLSITVGWA